MKTAEPLWAASFCVLSPLPCKSFFICSNRIPCFILCPLTLILPVDTTKEFGFICFISSCQVFIHMDKMLVRVFLTQLRMPLGFFAARVYCWPKGSLVSTRPTGPVLQSCFPTCRLPVPMHGDISPRVQDFALHFVELHEISVSSFLCYWRWIVAPVLIPELHVPWATALQVDLNLAVQLVFSSSDV